MNIIDFLKKEPGARLTYYQRWMIWNRDLKRWEVYGEATGGVGRLIRGTEDEENAIKNLFFKRTCD